MKFLIITHTPHKRNNEEIYGYGPYIKEMNLWLKHVDQVDIVAPMLSDKPNPIDLPYIHNNINFHEVASFNLLTWGERIKTLLNLPFIFSKIVYEMSKADHIHLRCPGNIGLLGTVAQIFFPTKIKTVKYAGNWDPKSPQPRSYRIQKSIISNTHLSKNIQVLVYGQWPNQSNNIKEFFTATYKKTEIEEISPRSLDTELKLVFVGGLSNGKRPLIAVEAVKELLSKGHKVRLDLMGEGVQRNTLENFIKENELENSVMLHGNQSSAFVKEKLKEAHFLILMSKSEGWPKVVAEAMFWGVIPITSNVSCVNYMIGEGSRGSLVEADGKSVSNAVEAYLENGTAYEKASEDAMKWSREFTLESFEKAIKELLDGK